MLNRTVHTTGAILTKDMLMTLVTLFKSQHSPSPQALLFQAAADSDVANLPASSTLRSAIDLTALASDQPSMLPSTAGDALLTVKLQDDDQVASQTACALLHERQSDQQKCLHCVRIAFGSRHLD